MTRLSELIALGLQIARKIVPSGRKVTLAGSVVTAPQLENATASLSVFFSAMSAAIKAKNFEAGAEVAIEEAVTIAADLGLGEPVTGIVSALLPTLFSALTQIGSQPLIDVNGTWITQQWADDPRHQLNRDGTFKY